MYHQTIGLSDIYATTICLVIDNHIDLRQLRFHNSIGKLLCDTWVYFQFYFSFRNWLSMSFTLTHACARQTAHYSSFFFCNLIMRNNVWAQSFFATNASDYISDYTILNVEICTQPRGIFENERHGSTIFTARHCVRCLLYFAIHARKIHYAKI